MKDVRDKVAIIILNYRLWQDTLDIVNMCNCSLNVHYKDIIVIDNASANDSNENIKEASMKSGFIFIQSERNNGYAAGNNIGLQYAYEHGYKYALILNNDVLIEDRKIIAKLLTVFDADDMLAVVNPDIYAVDGHLYNRDAKKPTFFDFTLGMNRYRKTGREVNDLGGYAYVYRPQGCCMMVDLCKLKEVDYMDEKTFLYCEEIILAERLLAKGYKCACCLTTRIVHNHSKTVINSLSRKKFKKISNRSFSYYLKTYRGYNEVEIWICRMFNNIKMILLGR